MKHFTRHRSLVLPLPPLLALGPLALGACRSSASPAGASEDGSTVRVAEAAAPCAARSAPTPSAEGPSPYDKAGFRTFEQEGRLWVIREDSEALQEFLAVGEPAKSITLIGVGPRGMTVRGPDRETIEAYLYAREGFHTQVVDGRLWVLEQGSEALAEFLRVGEPAKSITLVGAGPHGMTVRGADKASVLDYLVSRPGYHTEIVDGRLWVFGEGSAELEEYLRVGEPAKSVTLIGVGPEGMTVRGPDKPTVQRYLYGKPGFHVDVVDGRLWVFELGTESLAEFLHAGEPAKSVTLVGGGPDGMTLRGPDRATLARYTSS